MRWVTPDKIKVDRVACPWLIKDFVDPQVEFVFLPCDTDWARIDSEIVFEVPKSLWSSPLLKTAVYDPLYAGCKRQVNQA